MGFLYMNLENPANMSSETTHQHRFDLHWFGCHVLDHPKYLRKTKKGKCCKLSFACKWKGDLKKWKNMCIYIYMYTLYRSIYITWTIKLKVSEKSTVCIALYLQPRGELFRFAIAKQEFRRKSLVVFMRSVHPKPFKIITNQLEKKDFDFVKKIEILKNSHTLKQRVNCWFEAR